MQRVGREYWRRRNAYAAHHIPRWQDIPEDPDPDEGDGPDYDRFGMMMKIDSMERPWRDLINEYGFSWVMKAIANGSSPQSAARWLRGVREQRQWSNPNGQIEEGFVTYV